LRGNRCCPVALIGRHRHVLIDQGNHRNAVEYYEAALEIVPANPVTSEKAASVLDRQGGSTGRQGSTGAGYQQDL